MIDDAAAMAPEDRTGPFPAHVIERAPVNAKQRGGLGDSEEIRWGGCRKRLLFDRSNRTHGKADLLLLEY